MMVVNKTNSSKNRNEYMREYRKRNLNIIKKRRKELYDKNLSKNNEQARLRYKKLKINELFYPDKKQIRLFKLLNYRINNVVKFLFLDAKRRGKKNNIEFSIKESDIILPKKCPLLNLILSKNIAVVNKNSPSLDRINPKLGYNPDNIIVISHKANTIKNNLTLDQLLKLKDNFFVKNDKLKKHNDSVNYDKKINMLYKKAKERKGLYYSKSFITKDDIIIPQFCPILDIELCLTNNKKKDNSPSIDRINNKIGYTKNNVRVISLMANRAKSNSTYKEICKIVNNLKKIIQERNNG